MYEITCSICKITKTLVAPPRRTACRKCAKRGVNKNGVKDWRPDKYGYLHKFVNGKWTKQHRLVMEEFLGRRLSKNEHVHHVNGNKSDNRIENLAVLESGDHHREHSGILDRLTDSGLVCFTCKVNKPFDQFYKRQGRRLGYQGRCKSCLKEKYGS